jgi:hypothetical protein
MYRFICRPSDSTVSRDAGIKPRTVATSALTIRRSKGKRDMAMRRIFWGFCRNWFLIDPLHYLSSHSDFGFEFAKIFVFEKRLSD